MSSKKPSLAACGPTLAIVGIFSFFANVLMMTLPLYMLQAYDRVLTSHSEITLFWLTVIAIAGLCILGVIEVARSRVLVRVGAWIEDALSPALLSHAVQSAVLDPRDASVGGLRDLSNLRGFLGGSGIFNLFDTPWVPIYVTVIWLLHPWLGIVAIAGAVLLFVMALLSDVLTRRPLNEASAISNRLYSRADMTLRNAEVIESMGMLSPLTKSWQQENGKVIDLQARASDRAGILSAITRFIRLMVQIAIVAVGMVLAIERQVSPGAIIAASILLGRALVPVEQLIGTWKHFVSARAAYGRIHEKLSRPVIERGETSLPTPAGRLEVDQATVCVPGRKEPLLSKIDFALEAGESLGIVGPSAAGKSSLARLLVGIWPAQSGGARLDGANLFTWDRDDLGRHIGYLPQDIELFPGTVKRNIARMGEAGDAEVVAAAKIAGVHDMILRLPLGYDTPIGDGGLRLSGGQRQRIGLARAFFRLPRLLVLDEPNSNLDSDGERALAEALSQAKSLGITAVVIAHRAMILANVDKMLVLRGGKVEMFGPRSEIMPRLIQPAPAPVPAPTPVPAADAAAVLRKVGGQHG